MDQVQVFDSEYPYWTSPVTGGPAGTTTGDDETPTVQGVLSDVLGWRTREDDPTSFAAALKASFELTMSQGHVVSKYRPQGYATMADMGAVTGGQASLYLYAQALLTPMVTIINGLKPLDPAADVEDCNAFQALILSEVQNLVQALSEAGGPIVSRIDAYLGALLGWSTSNPIGASVIDGNTVEGQLGLVRTTFGYNGAFDNSPEDEQMHTSFWSLTDLVVNFARAWERERDEFSAKRSARAGFIGTDLVLISRALAAADAQVSELEAVVRSTLIADSEWATIRLPVGHITFADLINWLHIVLGHEATTIIQRGRDGVETSLTPIIRELTQLVRRNLWQPKDLAFPMLPDPPVTRLPTGMNAARTRIAVHDLVRLLREIVVLVARVHRVPSCFIVDTVITGYDDATRRLTVSTYVANGSTSFKTRLVVGGTRINAQPASLRSGQTEVTADFVLPAAVTPDQMTDAVVEVYESPARGAELDAMLIARTV